MLLLIDPLAQHNRRGDDNRGKPEKRRNAIRSVCSHIANSAGQSQTLETCADFGEEKRT